MLTTKPSAEAISAIADNARAMVADYIAAGINPEKVNIYLQSAIPEVCELNLIFEMLITVNRFAAGAVNQGYGKSCKYE